MTIEYNGFQYAGFQRQTATPRNTNNINADFGTTASSCAATPFQQQRPNKRSKKNKANSSIAIQDKIEMALQRWTNLSLETLRVRGAGRTDKGVHASGQVVAFDVPVRLLCDGGVSSDRIHSSTTSCDEGDGDSEVLSDQSAQLLQDAHCTLSKHCSETENENNAAREFADQWQIRRAITTRLPPDIVLRSVRMWAGAPQQKFEPRRQIACKTYTYQLRFRCLANIKSDDVNLQSSSSAAAVMTKEKNTVKKEQLQNIHPICKAGPHLLRRINDQNTIWLCTWPLDPALLRPACNAFVGNHDFVNFVHKEERKKASNKRATADENKSPHEIDLFEFNVDTNFERADDPSAPSVINATFTLKAKGFHRSMVRNLVGIVADVARGLRSVHDIPVLLLEKESETEEKACMMGSNEKAFMGMVNSAPACGLCLAKVEYEHDLFL